jgi:hypothetical protein
MTVAKTRRELAHLLFAALLFVFVIGALTACGTGDLIFPGDVPATPTSENTTTPVPTDTP